MAVSSFRALLQFLYPSQLAALESHLVLPLAKEWWTEGIGG
jgi:hypothetical protein